MRGTWIRGLEMAMDALRCPPPDTPDQHFQRRRKTPCRVVPFAAAKAGHFASRRADKPSRRGNRRVARTASAKVRRHDHRRHARPLFSRQCRRLDTRTRPRRGHSVEGKLFVVARAKKHSVWRRNRRRRTSGRKRSNASWNGYGCRRKAVTRNRRRVSTITKRWSRPNRKNASEDLEIYIPPGERLGDVVIEAHGVSKAYGDKLLFENLEFSLPPGGIVGVIGPNGAGKTTLFRLITGTGNRRTRALSRSARPSSSAMSTSRATALTPIRPSV